MDPAWASAEGEKLAFAPLGNQD